jgi:hypothetical protein
MIANHCIEVNQSEDIFYKFYVIKKPEDQILHSKNMVDLSNSLIFGSNPLLPDEKMNEYVAKNHSKESYAKSEYTNDVDNEMPVLEYEPNDMSIEPREKRNCKGSLVTLAMPTKQKRMCELMKTVKGNISNARHTSPLEVVDLTISIDENLHDHSTIPKLIQFPFIYTGNMRERILTGQWLTDEEMLAVLSLMRERFTSIGGLENTIVLSNLLSKSRAVHCKNIYIVHDSGSHWITAKYTCRRNVFDIYDSMQGIVVSKSVQLQLKNMGREKATFSMKRVQQQLGPSDCGLFAVAFAVDLANGLDPTNIIYDQKYMRSHLVECFDRNFISTFPRSSRQFVSVLIAD